MRPVHAECRALRPGPWSLWHEDAAPAENSAIHCRSVFFPEPDSLLRHPTVPRKGKSKTEAPI